METSKTRERITVSLEPAVYERIVAYMARTDRTFSGAVNWLVKRQLTLLDKDPSQDIAS